jgi:hypothetical protein
VSTVSWSALPLDFVANDGQWADETEFVARKGALEATFETDGVALSIGATALRLGFENATSATTIIGEEQRSGTYNFVIGNDPNGWREQVPAYTSVRYDDLYDGIDVRFRELDANLEYDVLVEPHADENQFIVRP